MTARACLGLIAALMLPAGMQAAFAPASFFEDFPVGRGWIAAEGGTYDEHLVRDVGFLFLAMIIVTMWTAWSGGNMAVVALAWLVQGIGHLVYHAGHLDLLGGIDQIGLIGSLVAIPLLGAVALWASLADAESS